VNQQTSQRLKLRAITSGARGASGASGASGVFGVFDFTIDPPPKVHHLLETLS
jgi:hypothetical protein